MNFTKMFQFHYGSIKGIKNFLNCWVASMFQFHYGSIKGSGGLIGAFIGLCFNSTMVRLKVL